MDVMNAFFSAWHLWNMGDDGKIIVHFGQGKRPEETKEPARGIPTVFGSDGKNIVAAPIFLHVEEIERMEYLKSHTVAVVEREGDKVTNVKRVDPLNLIHPPQ